MKARSIGSLLITSIYLCACNYSYNSNNKAEPAATYSEETGVQAGPVRFDFTASRVLDQPEIIEVKGWLINDLSDTVYYVTSSCYGEGASLEIDSLKYAVSYQWNCEEDQAVLRAIPPLSQNTFEAILRSSGNEERIQIGFNFYRVERGTNLMDMTYQQKIKSGSGNNILWSEERRFE